MANVSTNRFTRVVDRLCESPRHRALPRLSLYVYIALDIQLPYYRETIDIEPTFLLDSHTDDY